MSLALSQKGLNQTLQFDILMCMHPNEVWGVLAASTVFDITPQYICDEVAVQYSDNGSNKRTKEEFFFIFYGTSMCLSVLIEEM